MPQKKNPRTVYMIQRKGNINDIKEETSSNPNDPTTSTNTLVDQDDNSTYNKSSDKILTHRGVQADLTNLSMQSSNLTSSSLVPPGSVGGSFTSSRRSSSDYSKYSRINAEKNNYKPPPDAFHHEKDRIRVIVRVRPLTSSERDSSEQEIVHCEERSLLVEGKTHNRRFIFDHVFNQNAEQEEVFEYSGIKRLINMAIDGYVCTCFAYGQTGSGKTYTMSGPPGSYNLAQRDKFVHFGLIPRSINHLFNTLRERTMESDSNSVYYIRVSYYEIYNEQIRDLINPSGSNKLEIRGSPEDGFFVENLFTTYIETMDELLTILEEGELNRATAGHLLNDHSSRSHAVLTIQIENEPQVPDPNTEQSTRLGKLIFVDLAGSEKVKVTLSKGKQLVETSNINKSLMVLGTCISALSDPNRRDGHIPYRDSKLTKLLSECLGGSGITLMLATVSPSITCENETLNTLRYANRAQNIENAPIVKTDSRENVILRLKRELRKLKSENNQLKKQLGGTTPALTVSNSASRLPRISRNGSSNSTLSNDSQLFDKLKEYMDENKNLKSSNNELKNLQEKIRKQHEVLSRENEKLARKLEQVLRKQGKSSAEYVVVEETNLPKIETQPTYAIQSPRKAQTVYAEVVEQPEEVVEQYEIVRPTYSRKFKDIKTFKTKLVPVPDSAIKVKKVSRLPVGAIIEDN